VVVDGYLLDNQQAEAGERFAALSALFDGSTFRHLAALDIQPDWRCWEVGAGGPTVPAWLSERAHVLATDINTAWLSGGFEVRKHDVGTDPSPGRFDLVHARLVLVHVPTRAKALATMVESLRPGGWLVLEEADPALQPLVCLDSHGPAEQLANRLKQAFRTLMTARGVDLAFGRKLPRLMRDAGLVDVTADAYFPITGPACQALEDASVRQVHHRLVAAGLATPAEIAEHLVNVRSGRLDLATSPMVTAWARKPGTEAAVSSS